MYLLPIFALLTEEKLRNKKIFCLSLATVVNIVQFILEAIDIQAIPIAVHPA